MKQKILMLMMAVLCLGMAACGSDDEYGEDVTVLDDAELTGNYICTDFEFRNLENGELGSNGKGIADPVDINADHTFGYTEIVNGKVFRSNRGTWSRNGNQVSFSYENSTTTSTGTISYKKPVLNIIGNTGAGYSFKFRLVKQ